MDIREEFTELAGSVAENALRLGIENVTTNEVRECVHARFKGLDNDDLVNSNAGGNSIISNLANDEVLKILRFAIKYRVFTEQISMVKTSGARA